MTVDLEEVPCLSCGARASAPELRSAAQMNPDHTEFLFVRCQHCDLIRLSPRVQAEHIERYYDETYLPHRGAEAWGRYAPLVERAQRATDGARVRRVLSIRHLDSRSRVLDVGCGQPTFLRLLNDRTGATSVGLDFSSGGWAGAPDRWRGLQLHRGTVGTVELKPGFDVITLWHALEHEYEPLELLRRLRTWANRDAALIVEVPDYESWTRRLQGGKWAGLHTPRHTAAFTRATLAALVGRAGWTVERQLPYGTLDPYVLWWLGRQEQLGRDLSGDLSTRFASFVLGKVLTLPLVLAQRWLSLGVQTLIARASG